MAIMYGYSKKNFETIANEAAFSYFHYYNYEMLIKCTTLVEFTNIFWKQLMTIVKPSTMAVTYDLGSVLLTPPPPSLY
jgi:hypothetical protein